MNARPIIPAESWEGVNVLGRNCGHAEYANISRYIEGDCFVEYVFSDGQVARMNYRTWEEANDSLTCMGFMRRIAYTVVA